MNIILGMWDTKEQAQAATDRLNRIHDMAVAEMQKHGLISGTQDWDFSFDRAKRRMGRCSYRRRLITLSGPLALLNKDDEILDTIRHEIAHALAGPKAKHGWLWKKTAVRIGARPERCYGSAVVKPSPNWIGRCGTCEVKVERYRLTRHRMLHSIHTACRRKGLAGNVVWTRLTTNST